MLLLQVSCPAHCYHAVQLAHKSLRVPLVMSQVMQCRLLRRSRNSHSLSSCNAAASRLLLSSRLSCQFPFHPWTLLCRRLHLVTPFRMCPRRRLISRSPRYLLTWQYKRLSTVFTPHPWMLPCRRFHTELFLRTFLRRWVLAQLPRFLLMCLFRLPYAVRCYTILPHNYRSRSSLLDVSSRMILLIVRARHRYKSILVVSHCLHFLTLLRLAPSAVPAFTETVTCTLRLHMSCCSHHRVSKSMPRLQVSILICTLHMAYLLQRHLYDPGYVKLFQSRPPQPPAYTIHVGTHHARSASTGKRSASTALAGTHNLAITDSRAGSVPFPKPRALVLPLVHFGQSKPEGDSGLDTADSDLMHHQFRLSLLQWNPGPARRNPTNIVSAACGKFHAVILQEASDHVPHTSDQFMAYTGNTDLAILLNKDTFEPDPIVLTFKVDSTSKGTWGMILHIVCKGNKPCTSYSRTFTIHNYGYVNAYTFTHNNITLEHTAMNDKNTIAHTDAHNTQF